MKEDDNAMQGDCFASMEVALGCVYIPELCFYTRILVSFYLALNDSFRAFSFGGNGMNWELIKHKFCRLAVTASLLLGGVMVSAAASGTMPLWAALLGLFAAVVMLNAACGILLGTPAAEPRRAVPARTSRPAVQLCVVRGGHAA